MKNYSISVALLVLLLVACMGKVEEEKPVTFSETGLINFVRDSQNKNDSIALRNLDSLLEANTTDSTVFLHTFTLLDKYYGDPNSLYRNEAMHAALLQAKMQSPWTDSMSKARTREKLYLLMQNRVGKAANDFTYTTPEGEKKKLYDISANYTLLFFYNPECPACTEMKTALNHSERIQSKISRQRLKVLAIYTDKDATIWRKHLPENPAYWINARDENEYLWKNKIYDLRAIPTVYLLDREKKVLVKDAMTVREIENVLDGGE